MPRTLLVVLSALVLSACASSHVLTGRPRPPVPVSQVRVYFAPPPGRYEEIALLQSNSGPFTYGEQNKMDSVIGKLRNEAAKLGANGVLFQGTEDGYGGGGVSVGAGGGRIGGRSYTGGGVGIDISPRQKFAHGVAIYVLDPPPLSDPGPQGPPPRP
ncbi:MULTISPECIES: hypothetical protein [Lysobacter]|uniref:DUF4156 domain-containing protein n=1 Tax=Lysobacter firmicutimachus TaxID=1792846 RepID=A0ABU8CX02_9GAMM|nr:hypothetical protein [Lysobacter antibioticus]